MSGLWDGLADRVSRLLDAEERHAVRGDLAESGESGWQTLMGVLGLVARRQAALCLGWRPWVALLLAMPLGWRLTRESAHWAHLSAIYLWMYADNWRLADMGNTGFWQLLAHECGPFLLSCMLLMAGSMAVGMGLGFIARRGVWVAGVIYCAAMMVAGVAQAPGGTFGANAAAFAGIFYRSIYPAIVQVALMVLPAQWGMSRTKHRSFAVADR